MEIHQLRYFLEVARLGNFSRAAETCHVSQPSLSQQIRKLEEELGDSLFRRMRGGARLTPLGERLLPRARRILQELDEIAEDARAGREEIAGTISLGAIPTIAPYFLPPLMEVCLDAYPRLHLSVAEAPTHELADKLIAGQLDFALMSRPYPREDRLEAVTLFEDELLVALSAAHPLKSRRKIALPELADFPIVLMQDVHCLGGQSKSLCTTSDLSPRVSFESSQLETVVALVEGGMGFSFIPRMAEGAFAHRGVSLHSVHPVPASRDIVLAWAGGNNLTRAQSALRDSAVALGRQAARPKRRKR